ncbi:MAG: S-layer homology domain-containing protein [Oscillibacter sp.]|nr:S-layer homology domain-containing protein [Oscillibacter sp.]
MDSTREGQKTKLSVTYTAVTSSPVTYKWYFNSQPKANSSKSTYDCSEISAGTYTVTVEIYEGDTLAVTSNEFNLTVDKDSYQNKVTAKSGYKTSMIANQTQALEITIADQAAGTDYSVKWNSSKTDIATINESGKVGTLTAKNKTGSTKVTATVTYQNKDYSVAFDTISVEAADTKFGSVKNGDSDYYTDSQLTSLVVDAINKISTSSYTASDVTSIKIKELPNHVTLYADKIESSASLKKNADLTTPDRIYYEADKGYIDTDGDKTQLIVDVQLKNAGTPTVTISIPVVGDETIKETVTGNAANKDVTFTNSDYKYLYYTTSKVSDYDGYYTGSRVGDFGLPVAEDKTVTIPASAFKDKTTVTLYVVGVDKYDVASTGTIEVSQKSYAIEYNVVAGETLSFDQKAFESFMNDYADDNISTSKGDYFEFDYVKFTSLPNSTREGVLYEGKDKIKTSTEVENLDKVSFESVAKAKDTIKVPFTLYAKQYDKNDKVIDKKVSMTGEVVISVVKEDIVFEVGVNSAIKLGSDKFIDFLRDSDKSYKKADLDYVTFDVGKNSAITSYFNGTGALYRYYNGSTGINATVSAKDEFYYNPKTSSKHYDLDDVTYVTSKFAKVGDIVYIPFTAYGTKSGQKAEGTLAIKVKQTMNFVDVRPGDYFYDSVQWAVNLGITKGTSATTFSPKQGCTRAQIVTFLWRAANSPAPRSSTNKFTDVYATTHADYMKAIIWATEQGITTGTGNGKFSPDATCTRAQIVTFLYRFKNNPAVYGSLNFSDVNKTEHAAFYNAILWAVNNKITTGYGNGIFDPNGTCNRGDAVTFLYRALA